MNDLYLMMVVTLLLIMVAMSCISFDISRPKKDREKKHEHWLCECGGFIPERNPPTCISCGKEREKA